MRRRLISLPVSKYRKQTGSRAAIEADLRLFIFACVVEHDVPDVYEDTEDAQKYSYTENE